MNAIKILERRFNLFPAKFNWQGRIHHIDAVNECKTDIDNWSNQTVHHYWVRCDGQLFHLREVLPDGKWFLQSEDISVK